MSDVDSQVDTAEEKPLFWVGIGASAGGLEALRAFVRSLPNDLNATYVVAQHLSPHHRSMLPEIIGRETEFEVLSVEDQVTPLPNKIYITPQNRDVEIDGDRIKLVVPAQDAASPKPSVDRLFRSLAAQKGNQCIGIILSGTGSDGSRGIRDIRAQGGITLAQDEMSAKYSGMPVAAVESGCVDLVLSPEEMGAQFPVILEQRGNFETLKPTAVHLDGVSELIHLVHNQCRVNFRHYKAATLQRRIERRMAALGVAEIDDYVAIARTSEGEVETLFKDFLISVTSFFRDPIEFEALKHFIRQLLETKGTNEPIRVWVAGAATGEEVYSIAMLFADCCGGLEGYAKRKLQLFASDIDEAAIEIGRRGYYAATALDEVPQDYIENYFNKVPTGYVVKKPLRDSIVFSIHNIIQDPPFLNIDLISCRNLLIYFQNSLQANVLSRLHYALGTNGILFLGKSETVSANESLFRPAEYERHIYYQRPTSNRSTFVDISDQGQPFRNPSRRGKKEVDERDVTTAHARFDSVVKALGPDGFLIGSNLMLKKAYGDVNPYINVASGMLSLSISSLIKEPFGQEIRTAIPIVLRKLEPRHGIAYVDEKDPQRRLRVSVYPIEAGPDEEVYALAIIKSWHEDTIVTEQTSDQDGGDLYRQNEELRRELALSQSNLQQVAEELETSNEELQALNEELQSSNEELQSTNEELETSNEELQSTNEELSTVNEELQVSTGELTLLNQNLKSILSNISIPLIVVDAGLNILHLSNASSRLFKINTDIELPHLSLIERKEDFPDLVSLANEAIITKRPYHAEVITDAMNAFISIVPNAFENGKSSGAIILISDNTSQLSRARNELQLIFDNIPQGIFARDFDGKILRTNKSGREMIGAQSDTIEGQSFYDFFPDGVAETVKQQDIDFIESGDQQQQITERFRYKFGGERWVRVTRIRSKDQDGSPILYAMGEDLTSEYDAADALKKSEERQDLAIKAANIGLWDLDLKDNSLWWSDRFKQIAGIEDAAFAGQDSDFFDRLHPEDRERIQKAVANHLEQRIPYDVAYRLLRADGSYAWIEAKGQATWDEDGKPLRMIGSVDDVSERNRNIWALQERSAQLQQAARLSGLGYWRIDLLDQSLFWSDEIYKIHGLSPDSYRPEVASAVQFYHEDDVDAVNEFVRQAMENNEPFEFEARLIRPDGEVRFVKTLGEVVAVSSEKPHAIFGVILDITEERRREARMQQALDDLSKSNEELSRFSYVCSHDMKEPVRLIHSMCDLLLDEEIKNDAVERDDLIERISINTKRLGDIIESLLAYSRVDEKIETIKVDLGVVVEDRLEALALQVAQTGAQIEHSDLPIVVGARVHFEQLFQNLISNAIKFSDKDTPQIRVCCKDLGEMFEISVEDNGPGIPVEARDEVFTVFRRLQLRNEIDGTGLGLSICQRIVTQYGGHIKVGDSADLGGAAFIFTLPKPSGEVN